MLAVKPISVETFDRSHRAGLRTASAFLFEERFGTNVADSLNEVLGTFEGNLTESSWGSSPYGGGLAFSDAPDRVAISSGESRFFDGISPISGFVVFYLNQLPSSAGRSFELFVRYDGSTNKLIRLFVDQGDDECKLSVDGVGGTNVSTGGSALSAGAWYVVHFEVTEVFDNLRVWVDGELDSTTGFTDTALAYGDGVLYLGGDGVTGTTGLDGVLAFLCFNVSEIDDVYARETYFDPFLAFRVEAHAGDTFFTVISAEATFDQDPQLVARYSGKEGLDLIADYGLEEMEVGQESNLHPTSSKGVHGVSVSDGALGEKIVSLRGVISEASQQLCYIRLNRLSAHIKLLVPTPFWVWDDRMIYTIGGDITWSFIPGSGGKSVSWAATLICTDPFFSNTVGAEWQTPQPLPYSSFKLTTKGNAPTWPIFVIKADRGEDVHLPLWLRNKSVDPEWSMSLYWPGVTLYYRSPQATEVIIDGSVRSITVVPGTGDPNFGKILKADHWLRSGDYIWVEGGPKGRESDMEIMCGMGAGTLYTLLRNQWY